jgi:carboxypeptidase C (cathepsin A)
MIRATIGSSELRKIGCEKEFWMEILQIQNATAKALEYAPQVIRNGSDFSVEGFEVMDDDDGMRWTVIIGYTPSKETQDYSPLTLTGVKSVRQYKDFELDSSYNLVKMSPYQTAL